MIRHEGSFMADSSIHQVNIEREMRDAYLDYAMSVIVSRALPDDTHRSEEHTSELQSH